MARPPRTRVNVAAIAAALPDFDDFDQELSVSLREMAERDPLPGAPWRVQIGREPDDVELVEPGQWRQLGHYNKRTQLPTGCPVTPLGKIAGVCFFLNTLGQIHELPASASGKGPIGDLFGGRSRFLEWAWPRWNKDHDRVVGWEADDARQALVDACAFMGPFEIEDQVRGRGMWRDGKGALVYHAGDAIAIDGVWRSPGWHEGLLYPARPSIGRPWGKRVRAGEDGPAEQLLDVLASFNWDRAIDAKLMLGWIVTAKMGGALDRRPVCFLTGGEGSGKSTLQWVLRSAMNGALIKSSNTTQAGIYQRLGQDSIAIMVDEFEGKDDTRTSDKILELARIAYSGDSMQRGGKDGVGKEFQLHSSFLGSAVVKPATDATDDSRMFVGVLRPRELAGEKLKITLAELDAIGRHLLRRIFDGWARWPALLEAFRGALIGAGHDDRAGDTFAPLAAACHLALGDGLPTPAELAEWAAWLAPEALDETANREKTWQRCFEHLLGAEPDAFRQAGHKTLGSVLAAYRERPDKSPEDLDDYARKIGLAVSWPEAERFMQGFAEARLFVPTTSAQVHGLLEGTPWAGRLGAKGPWAGVLRQAPKELWSNGKCEKGYPKKVSGLFIRLAAALDA